MAKVVKLLGGEGGEEPRWSGKRGGDEWKENAIWPRWLSFLGGGGHGRTSMVREMWGGG